MLLESLFSIKSFLEFIDTLFGSFTEISSQFTAEFFQLTGNMFMHVFHLIVCSMLLSCRHRVSNKLFRAIYCWLKMYKTLIYCGKKKKGESKIV